MKHLWEKYPILICAGTGGVGKTTLSAALGIAAAASGRKTLVMTIDPAKRLASALGFSPLHPQEKAKIHAATLEPHGVALQAPLEIMMPNLKNTFDSLIQRLSPNPQRIFDNPIYEYFSTVLAGSHEYAAIETLYEVHRSQEYDLLILDTPPSQNALDFLNAPTRMLEFMQSDTLQWLFNSTQKAQTAKKKLKQKLFSMGSSLVFKTMSKLTGEATLHQVVDFIRSFQGMHEGFAERAGHVLDLLASPQCAFVLVTSPQPQQLRSMFSFHRELLRRKLPVRALLLNRVHPHALQKKDLSALDVGDLSTDLINLLQEEIDLIRTQKKTIFSLKSQIQKDEQLFLLPELPHDVHNLQSLCQIQQILSEMTPEEGIEEQIQTQKY